LVEQRVDTGQKRIDNGRFTATRRTDFDQLDMQAQRCEQTYPAIATRRRSPGCLRCDSATIFLASVSTWASILVSKKMGDITEVYVDWALKGVNACTYVGGRQRLKGSKRNDNTVFNAESPQYVALTLRR
jgi:hypothetical protein